MIDLEDELDQYLLSQILEHWIDDRKLDCDALAERGREILDYPNMGGKIAAWLKHVSNHTEAERLELQAAVSLMNKVEGH